MRKDIKELQEIMIDTEKKYFMVNIKMETNFMGLNIIYMEREKNL
jgi:hypothetical protein